MARSGFGRNFMSGIVTLIPLGMTWFLLDFIFTKLSSIGRPIVNAISFDVREDAPGIASFLRQPWFDDLLAAFIVVIGVYALGWATNRVIGRKIFNGFEWFLEQLPFVKTIYSSVKRIASTFQSKPESSERVVLIDFPNAGMKAVGLVSRTFSDAKTGEKLAAVYVPTTPNPTSGFLEIVPVAKLTPTDWTIDQAMGFVISGGSNPPSEGVSIDQSQNRLDA